MSRAGNWLGNKLFGNSENEAMRKQQEMLQKLQLEGNKVMLDQLADKERMMIRKSMADQVAGLESAGLSKSLMYGGSGAGGTTGGSAGAPSTAVAENPTDKLMASAQLELMKAQAEKTKAEAENISGVERDIAGEELKYKKFDNDVRSLVTEKASADAIKWANDKIQIESEKANADWEAYKAGAFDGKSYDDKNSPVAKAINAGFNNAVEELKQTRLENNAKEAENIVKRFEARMAESGIHPNSPWYVKLIGDLLERAGITDVLQAGAKRIGGK